MKILMIHSTIRGDEKLIIKEAKEKKVDLDVADIRKLVLDPREYENGYDVVLERSLSTTLGTHATFFFESLGIPVVNPSEVARVCENKFATSLALWEKDIATIPFAMAFTEEQALEAVERLGGFPVVIKPPSGSWGRLLGKINDKDALEAIIEQKMILGGPVHKAFYIQKFMEKPGRDIRVTMAGEKVVCAIYRESEHWITNTARGAIAKPLKVDDDLREICLAASEAVGGGVLGIDALETKDGYMINEVNHTTEFKNVQRVTGENVAGAILDYCMKVGEEND